MEHPVRIAKVRAVTKQVIQNLRSDARDNRERILSEWTKRYNSKTEKR